MNFRNLLFANKLAMVLILSYLVVKTALLPGSLQRSLSPESAPGMGRVGPLRSSAVLPRTTVENYAEIVRLNPFRPKYSVPDSQEQADSFVSAADEKIGLVLFGTTSGNPDVARAIIKDTKTGTVNLYRTRQMVGDALIESIETDSVVLLHHGRLKTLRLSAAVAESYTYEPDSSPPVPVTEQTGPENYRNHRSVKTELEYIEAVLRKATIEPHIVNGRVEGLRITGLRSIEYAGELGLKDGDIIRSVNGHQLTGKLKAYQVFKREKRRPVMDIELIRDDEVKRLSFVLE